MTRLRQNVILFLIFVSIIPKLPTDLCHFGICEAIKDRIYNNFCGITSGHH